MKTLLYMSLVMLCVLFAGCGIFNPRQITEVPAVETGTTDPFNLGVLLDGTGEAFSDVTWQEFLHTDLKYVNVNFASNVYSKELLVSHLLQQHEINPTAIVVWTPTQAFSRDADRIILTNVLYVISDSLAPDAALFTGSCDFEIVRDAATSVWHIIAWRDLSDDAYFSPDK